MDEVLKQRCIDCGFVYDPAHYHNFDLVDRDFWECPGNGEGLCGATIDRYEIVEPTSPLDDAEDDIDDSAESDAKTNGSKITNQIFAQKADKAVVDLVRMVNENELVLRPDWQRYYVWSAKQASLLVESLFLRLPIPLIYIAEELDGSFSVVDGQQRLTALYEFVSNKHIDPDRTSDVRLTGLEVRSDLNGKTFAELDPMDQKFLKNSELQIIRLKSQSDPDLKLKVFQRLNTGSVKLNAQELRNAAYRGAYNNALKKWARNPTFLKILRSDAKPDIRMMDVEMTLRASAWNSHGGWQALQSKNIGAFLDEEMKQGSTYSAAKLKKLEQQFKTSIELSWQAFGSRAFRRYYFPTVEEGEIADGHWEMRQPNKALFDVVMYGFARRSKGQVWPHLEAIREALIDLMARDGQFQDAITAGTTDPRRVNYRFKAWEAVLDDIIQDSAEPRAFSRKLKVELFEADSTCALCGQGIHDIDDAHVHHVEHYWRGGKTIPENAALAHRYCNLREGGG